MLVVEPEERHATTAANPDIYRANARARQPEVRVREDTAEGAVKSATNATSPAILLVTAHKLKVDMAAALAETVAGTAEDISNLDTEAALVVLLALAALLLAVAVMVPVVNDATHATVRLNSLCNSPSCADNVVQGLDTRPKIAPVGRSVTIGKDRKLIAKNSIRMLTLPLQRSAGTSFKRSVMY